MLNILLLTLFAIASFNVLGSTHLQPLELDLTISPEDWSTITTHKWEDLSVPCRIKERKNQEFVSCKINIHGGLTRTYPKFSFKIVTDKNLPAIGIDHKMVLKAEWGDGSYLRNDLSFLLFKNYTKIPVVQRRPVILNINGSPYGIMIEQESIKDSFLKKHGINNAYLFKSDPPDDLFKKGAGGLLPLKNLDQYPLAYQASNNSEDNYEVLIDFIDRLWNIFDDKQFNDVKNFVNEEEVTSYLAVMGIIQNSDISKKNFYLSINESSAKDTMLIPHDLDITWGCKWVKVNGALACGPGEWYQPIESGTLGRLAVSKFPTWRDTNLLYQVIWDNPSSALKIKKKVCSIINSVNFVSGLNSEIDRVSSWVKPHLSMDKMGRLKDAEYSKSIEFLRGFILERKKYLNESLCQPLGLK